MKQGPPGPCSISVNIVGDTSGPGWPGRVQGIVSRWLQQQGRARVARLFMVAVASVVMAGCKTDVTVGVRQVLDGSGDVTVTLVLDREAAAQSGDLRKVLRTADLEGAGWDITGPFTATASTDVSAQPTTQPSSTVAGAAADTTGGPTVDPGGIVETFVPEAGSVSYVLTKTFRNSGEAQLILTELSGEDGPFSSLVVDRTRSPLRIVSSMKGAVDLTKGYDAFGDQVIARQFQTESPIGLSAEDIQKRFNKPLEELVPLHLTVQLNNEARRTIALPSGQRTPVAVRSVAWKRWVLFPMGAALLSLVALGISFRRRD